MKNITIGVLAHVDAGKTTLSEQLLFRGGARRSCGCVDRQDSCLDFAPVERRRGITVYAAQADFLHGDTHYFLVDTPGHVDFAPEMERCLAVLDYAILVVSCTSGIQAHTETVWRMLRERGIPTFLFLNKADCPGANPVSVLESLQSRLGGAFCDLTGGWTEQAVETAAMTDERLLPAYLEDNFHMTDCIAAASKAVAGCMLFPFFVGSARGGDGVDALLEAMDQLCTASYDSTAPLRASAYQVRYDRHGCRMVFLKVLAGVLRPRQSVGAEKIQELRRCIGSQWTALEQATAGELVAVTGLRALRAGEGIGEQKNVQCTTTPLLLAQICPEDEENPANLLGILRRLEDEEPTLSVRWNAELRQIHLAVMGEVQLEVLQETLAERFGLRVKIGESEIVYLETINQPAVGCGHYEPLRHYAEVHLRVEPGQRGSGITFASECATDVLAQNWQRLIETHCLEKQHVGALAGMPLTDVRIVLLAGRAHEKHTEGGDFRQATYRAVRQALFHAELGLLEPYYRFSIETDPAAAGRILADMAILHGTCEPPESDGTRTRLTGRCPVATMLPYSRGFAALTHGTGILCLEYDGYEPCHNTDEVTERIGYQRERDTENPADSVFCSHGAGFFVKWSDAPAMMHLKLD